MTGRPPIVHFRRFFGGGPLCQPPIDAGEATTLSPDHVTCAACLALLAAPQGGFEWTADEDDPAGSGTR